MGELRIALCCLYSPMGSAGEAGSSSVVRIDFLASLLFALLLQLVIFFLIIPFLAFTIPTLHGRLGCLFRYPSSIAV